VSCREGEDKDFHRDAKITDPTITRQINQR
jgi:hypothetical protein